MFSHSELDLNRLATYNDDVNNEDSECQHDVRSDKSSVIDNVDEEEEEEAEEEDDDDVEVDDDITSAFTMRLIGRDESRGSIDRLLPLAEQHSVDALLVNIQGLIKMAAENARHRERQAMIEKGRRNYPLTSFALVKLLA